MTGNETTPRKEHDKSRRRFGYWTAAAAVVGIFIATILFLQYRTGVAPVRVLDPYKLEIASKNGVHVFAVELAATTQAMDNGLMNRTELAEGRGMLFDYKLEQPVSFWMRNTYIPLDMFFIRGDGGILRIEENAQPLSEREILSGGSVRAVFEVIGGTARKLGIAPGDRVTHPIFARR